MTANYLYQPSYISLDSALSFYGVITGFSYKITSVSTKKTRSLIIDEKGEHKVSVIMVSPAQKTYEVFFKVETT